ncbi:hypothetical protein KPL71_015194 [Citrus sinensis]|uniref:Uncharacterized protein n=1 Tax=Citrus sinensis TaxID=2711 RepID=A0ACB8KHA8_CITSI|nr:hypothetical protein KPL71_015194 [Citrus sinensis]
MVNSPQEVIGLVLKYMGASYNLIRKLLVGRLLFSRIWHYWQTSTHYLKAFGIGDVWIAVGWSSDVLPAVKRMSNVAVVVPKSGASLWADLWPIPAASRLETKQIGGRVRGPFPLIHQWIEFCLQTA